MIRLFRGSLSAATLRVTTTAVPTKRTTTFGGGLAAGNYVLAVGAFFMTINEAVTGNASTPIGNNNQFARFSVETRPRFQAQHFSSLGLGLLGLVAVRKK